MAGAMIGGSTPWWTSTQGPVSTWGPSVRASKEAAAPPGYEFDPVKNTYVRTPTSAGGAVKAYTEAAMPDSLKALLGTMSGGGGSASTGSSASVSGGGGAFGSNTGQPAAGLPGFSGAGSQLPTLQLPDQKAATDAAYATAKDKVGKSGRASIEALRGELGASGMLGGGAEGQLVRDVVTSAAGDLGQVSRDQASKSADLAADFAKTGYAGGITQRGQDVQAAEAQARLAQEQRLADASLAFQKQNAASQQQLQMLQLALGGLKGLGSGSYSY